MRSPVRFWICRTGHPPTGLLCHLSVTASPLAGSNMTISLQWATKRKRAGSVSTSTPSKWKPGNSTARRDGSSLFGNSRPVPPRLPVETFGSHAGNSMSDERAVQILTDMNLP